MRPIPETVTAIDELDAYLDDGNLLEEMTLCATKARVLVPDVLAVAITDHQHGVTFSFVGTGTGLAAMYGSHDMTGDAIETDPASIPASTTVDEDPLNEPEWQVSAKAAAPAGVCSTLTLPIIEATKVVASVNIYAACDDSFADQHVELAAVFGAWAPGAVANADLSCSALALAKDAPGLLRAQAAVDAATGLIAATHDVDMTSALSYLIAIARQTGLPLNKLAEVMVALQAHPASG